MIVFLYALQELFFLNNFLIFNNNLQNLVRLVFEILDFFFTFFLQSLMFFFINFWLLKFAFFNTPSNLFEQHIKCIRAYF